MIAELWCRSSVISSPVSVGVPLDRRAFASSAFVRQCTHLLLGLQLFTYLCAPLFFACIHVTVVVDLRGVPLPGRLLNTFGMRMAKVVAERGLLQPRDNPVPLITLFPALMAYSRCLNTLFADCAMFRAFPPIKTITHQACRGGWAHVSHGPFRSRLP
jgi:hypothetical protein